MNHGLVIINRKHIHVFRDRKYIAKVELDDELTVMEGKITAQIRAIIRSLIKEGYFK